MNAADKKELLRIADDVGYLAGDYKFQGTVARVLLTFEWYDRAKPA
jgi:hypothetical protein